MNLSNFTILVTGGAGFIGSNLCKHLLTLNNKVICLDNFSTGKFENIKNLIDNKKFKLIVGDIRNLEDCYKATENVDYILHQAALGSVPRSIKDPITTNEVNISGFLNMLIAARDNKIQRFVYAASSSTYGDSFSLPKVEDKIGKPLSPYAITKYVNELYADVFSKTYNMEFIGLRYFNVFGPNQNPNGEYAAVIPKFISSLINNEPITINGNGEYSRDFTYVENVIEANKLALTVSNNEAINTVYNIAYGERTTLNQLIKLLIEHLSYYNANIAKSEIQYGKVRVGDIPHSLASIDKAKKILGYDPKFDIEKGIINTVKWYMNNCIN